MIDHAPRIRAQQQAEKENAEMAELEKRSAPLHYALLVAVIAFSGLALIDQTCAFFQHYNDLASINEAMVQCLNGHVFNVDGVLVTCNTHQRELVAQVQP